MKELSRARRVDVIDAQEAVRRAACVGLDHDGVIVRFRPGMIKAVLEAICRHFNKTSPWQTEDEVLREYGVDGIRPMLASVGIDVDRYREQIDPVFRKTCRRYERKLYDDVASLFRYVRASGRLLVIVSNNNKEKLEADLGPELYAQLDLVIGLEDMGDRFKPDPYGLELVVSEFKLGPEEIAYFGDHSGDMRCAAAAGAMGIGTTDGACPAELLRQNGAVDVIERSVLPLLFA